MEEGPVLMGESVEGLATAVALNKGGSVRLGGAEIKALAQIMTNQIVLLNAVDALIRRQFEPGILQHVGRCIQATSDLQKPLLASKEEVEK